MTDDAFYRFGSNGPEIAQEVKRSLEQIQGALAAAGNKQYSLGNLQLAGLERLEKLHATIGGGRSTSLFGSSLFNRFDLAGLDRMEKLRSSTGSGSSSPVFFTKADIQGLDRLEKLKERVPNGPSSSLSGEVRSLNDVTAATERAAKAQSALLASGGPSGGAGEAQPPGAIQSFLGGAFGKGIKGGAFDPASAVSNLAATFGSVARYSLLYGAFSKLTQVFGDTLQEASDMADSMRDLNIAMGDAGPASQEFVNNLTKIAAFAGANVGEALDAAAKGVRAFTDASDSAAEKERVGTAFARTATTLSLLTGGSVPDQAGNLLAASNAFGGAAGSMSEFSDAVASVQNRVGGDGKQISQGLASIAGAAKEAGFSLDETTAAIGLVQARTDESGQAVATRLSRIFSTLGGSTGRSIIATINDQILGAKIDPNATVHDQFKQIAFAYKSAAPELQGLIRNALGGTSNVKELLPILNHPEEVFGFKADPGAGFERADQASQSLAGTLRKLQGDITGIQTELVNTDIFAPFGVGLTLLEKIAAEALQVLSIFNKFKDALPFGDELAAIAFTAAEVLVAVKAFKALGGTSAVTSGFGLKGLLSKGSPVAAAEEQTASGVRSAGFALVASIRNAAAQVAEAGYLGAAESYAGGAGRLGTTAGFAKGATKGVGSVGAAALGGSVGTAGALGLALAALTISTDTAGLQDDIKNARAGITNQLDGRTLVEASQAIKDAASALEKEQGGISSALVQPERYQYIKESQQVADILQKLSDHETAQPTATARVSATDFTSGADAFRDKLKALSDEGLTAAEVFGVLTASVREFVGAAHPTLNADVISEQLIRRFSSSQISDAINGAGLVGDVTQAVPGTQFSPFGGAVPGAGANGAPFYTHAPANDVARKFFEEHQVQLLNDLQAAAAEAAQTGTLDTAGATQIGQQHAESLAAGIPGLSDADRAKVVDVLTKMFLDVFHGFQGDVVRTMSAAVATAVINAGTENAKAKADRAGLPKDKLAALKNNIINANATLASVNPGDDLAGPLQAVGDAKTAYAEAQIADLQKLLTYRQSTQDTIEGKVATGADIVKRMLRLAAESGNADLVIQVLASASSAEVAVVESSLRRALRVARAAKAQADAVVAAALTASGSVAGQLGNSQLSSALAAQGSAGAGLSGADAALQALLAGKHRAPAGQDQALAEAQKQAAEEAKRKAEEARQEALALAEAKNALAAAQAGGGIAQSTADLANARLALDAAKKGTSAYYQALVQFVQAQRSFSDATLNFEGIRAQLNSDLSDPVAQAALALQAAQRKLAADKKSGAGKDIIAQDQLSVQQAQQSAEQAAFSQRLQDAQISEQLGHQSHAAYIKYLRSEHDRLAAIQHRTRQQTDELNQIDLAIKAAAEQTAGQFNFSEVRLPSPYEVRRFVATEAASTTYQAQTPGVTKVYVNGADTGEVRSILSELLGATAQNTSGSSTRKG